MSWTPPHWLALVIASMACWLERQAGAQIDYLRPRTARGDRDSQGGAFCLRMLNVARVTIAGSEKSDGQRIRGAQRKRALDRRPRHEVCVGIPYFSCPRRKVPNSPA